MNNQLLSEQEHKEFLDMYLDVVKSLNKDNLENLIPLLSKYSRDSLNTVKLIGYDKLYEEYKTLFDKAGL